MSDQPQAVSLSTVALALAGVALLWVTVLALHLTPALFGALITYGGTRAIAAPLARWVPRLPHVQAWALGLCVALVALVMLVVIERAAVSATSGGGYAALLQQMAAAVEKLRDSIPTWLAPYLPASLDALREEVVKWLRGHAAELQLWGGHTVRGLGYGVAGVVIGAMLVLQVQPLAEASPSQPPVAGALRRGFDELVAQFTAVVFAQARIAAVNTVLSACYLLVVLPLLGSPLPLAGTLVAATFVCSLIPVVGNLVSNTMIVALSLTHSAAIAALSLAWLVFIHKLEYVLNALIIGGRIRAQAWELLMAMLVMEALFGLAGLVSAPVINAQGKAELIRRGWL